MREDLHALAAPYALDALRDDERQRFEAHLAGCEACTAEVRQFTATTALLGMAAPTLPPPHVRERVLASFPRVRQLPPELPNDQAFRDVRGYQALPEPLDFREIRDFPPADRDGRPPRRRDSRDFATTRGGWASHEIPGDQAAPAEVHPLPRRRGRGRRAAVLLLAAACVIAATVSGGVALHERQQRERAEAAYNGIASVLSAPDARAATGRATGGGTATIVASPSRGRVVFTSSGLRALPSSQTYQLWLIGRTGPRSAGLVADPGRPFTTGNWQDTDKVALTVEPAGGSARPTTTPLVVLTTR